MLVVCCFFHPITLAYADNGSIFQHHQTMIPKNQSVENMVVVGGGVFIHGTVREAVIVINGDLHLSKTAKLPGFIFVLGGHLYQENGAKVTDDVISFSLDDATSNSMVFGGIFLVSIWVIGFVLHVFSLLFVSLFTWSSKNRLQPFVELARLYPARLLAIGLATNVFLIALGILLSFTMIGISFLVILILLVIIQFLMGFTVLSSVVGGYIPGMAGKPQWLQSLLGAAFLLSLTHFPLIGGVVLMGLFWFSLGILVWWLWAKRKKHTRR